MSVLEEEHAGEPLLEDISDSDAAKPSVKRKRDEGDVQSTESKRAKKKRTKKPKDVDDDALDMETGVNHAIAHMDSRLMADHIAQRTKRFQPDLSLVEIEDKYISATVIRDTSAWEKPRTLDTLPLFLDKYAAPRRKKKKGPRLSDAADEKGAPHTLVVAASGIRAADMTRALRHFQTKDAMVAKLFAKHIKLKEAIDMTKKTRMNIGVGTPQRLMDLLDDGALSIDKLERIVIDASHIDQKKRGILDMKETQVQLLDLLCRPDMKDRYEREEDEGSRVELIFF